MPSAIRPPDHLTTRTVLTLGLSFALLACGGNDSPPSKPVSTDPGDDGPTNNVPPGTMMAMTFGSAPEQLGAVVGDEAASLGPSSLAVDSQGRVHVLDAVNARIQVSLDGKVEAIIPVPSPTVDDLALLPDGNLLLLDRITKRLTVIDREGEVLSQAAVEGIGIPEAGEVAGMQILPDGVWLRGRRRLVHVLDAAMRPVTRRVILPTRLSRDGQWLISVRVAGVTMTVVKRERMGMPQNRTVNVPFDHYIASVIGQDTDASGKIYVATYHSWGKGEAREAENLLTVLSPDLEVEQQVPLPVQRSGIAVYRYLDVTPQGAVYMLDLNEDGAAVRKIL